LPHPADETEPSTLPNPEHNPLLNPLLAAHMGRWAEVYFTNPPEKRGQAIAELLRELESLSPQEAAPVQVIEAERVEDERVKEKTEMVRVLDSSPATEEPLRICSACAYHNSAGQKFCGMCGAPLPSAPETTAPAQGQGAEPAPTFTPRWSEPEISLSANAVDNTIEPAISSPAVSPRRGMLEPAWPLPENDFPSFGVDAAPVPYPFRLYVGVALAILLVVLIYMAWRGTKAFSGSSSTPSQSATAGATASAVPPAQVAPTPPAQPPRTARSEASGDRSTGSAKPVSDEPNKTQPEATLRNAHTAAAQPPSKLVTVAASSPTTVAEPSGAQELATAQKYLEGQGVTRDSKEAALWLWKAVGKGNVAATIALSDLYLRGNGVTKNCDQARLLLDAAARKGERTAAERLRNLQAFGCE
jgi:hypothetical protein